ncbi:MAG: hypothetical protein KDB07_05855 [Planctomycetes bacterium]|nr:hypothetical protein [Planctomycetota bacterium]
MEAKPPIQPDTLLDSESSAADRERLQQLVRDDHRLRDKVLEQHLAHGLLHAEVDRQNGSTFSRTQSAFGALQELPSLRRLPNPRMLVAAAVLILVGALGVVLVLQNAKPDEQGQPVAVVKPPLEQVPVDGRKLLRQASGEGELISNLGKVPEQITFETGLSITLDQSSSLVVVDGGNRLTALNGRIGIEGRATRVQLTELDAMVFGGPVVADTGDSSLYVYSGKVSSIEGNELVSAGKRYDLRTGFAEPFNAGRLPDFIAEGRSEELYNELQARAGDETKLDSAVWKPVLHELMSKPVGRDLAGESLKNILALGMTEKEFAELIAATNISLAFLFEVEGVQGAVSELDRMLELWAKSTPEERERIHKQTEYMLEGWRTFTPEQQEQWRKVFIERLKNHAARDGKRQD